MAKTATELLKEYLVVMENNSLGPDNTFSPLTVMKQALDALEDFSAGQQYRAYHAVIKANLRNAIAEMEK